MKFEYYTTRAQDDLDKLGVALTKAGEQGWELVYCERVGGMYRLAFKRPKSQPCGDDRHGEQ